jgi:hypothetical protein
MIEVDVVSAFRGGTIFVTLVVMLVLIIVTIRGTRR